MKKSKSSSVSFLLSVEGFLLGCSFNFPSLSNIPYVVRSTINSVRRLSWLHISCFSLSSFRMKSSVSTSFSLSQSYFSVSFLRIVLGFSLP